MAKRKLKFSIPVGTEVKVGPMHELFLDTNMTYVVLAHEEIYEYVDPCGPDPDRPSRLVPGYRLGLKVGKKVKRLPISAFGKTLRRVK